MYAPFPMSYCAVVSWRWARRRPATQLSVAHQMSNVVLVACCLTGVEVVPQGGWDASPELSDG